ncbi:MAG: putative Ig domain-containing protein, partial [Armatimonadetes bacterium]|nr:putative Ig domain-containing protein [Armatimonadota bacterium]
FRWKGPRVPLNVRAERTDEGIVLRWEPNPRGERPVSYEVYGSDEKGFSVHKQPYRSYRRGEVPANFLGSTTDTSMLVVSPDPTHENMNRCYYRVVAVDANGTQSICSDFAEMPHPYIWTRPPAEAKAGQAFTYRPGVISSLGDVQHRTGKDPVNDLWEREVFSFKLAEGPAWLKIDEKTGELSGTPNAAGTVRIAIEVTTQFEGRDRQEFDLVVK